MEKEKHPQLEVSYTLSYDQGVAVTYWSKEVSETIQDFISKAIEQRIERLKKGEEVMSRNN